MPADYKALMIYAIVIVAYLGFTAFVVWVLANKIPRTTGRVLLAVTVVVGGLPPILLALHQLVAA